MNKYTVTVPESSEVEAKRFLCRHAPDLYWCTKWVENLGYVTIVTFDNQEDAVEFQLKFLDNIDYSHAQT